MLELLTWTATGLVAGWLVRTMMRTRRDLGLAGDLVTGWLGGELAYRHRIGVATDEGASGEAEPYRRDRAA